MEPIWKNGPDLFPAFCDKLSCLIFIFKVMAGPQFHGSNWGMTQLVGHIAFDLKLWSSIHAIFFEKELLHLTPTLLTVSRGLAWCSRKLGSPPTSSVPPS